MKTKFIEFKKLYENGIELQKIKKDLDVSKRMICKYIKQLKEPPKIVQVKSSQQMQIYDKCKVTYLKTFYNTCINLSDNGYKNISIEDEYEILTTVNDDVEKLKITVDNTPGDSIILFFKLFTKQLFLKERKHKPTAKKEIHTIYTCDRNNVIQYQEKFWSVKRCIFKSLGCPDKLPYELRRFCNIRYKVTRKDSTIKKWIVYDIEAMANKQNVMTPYLIVAIEFDPTGQDANEQVWTFECDSISQIIETTALTNPVVNKFRDFIIDKLYQSYQSFKSGENGINYSIFGYNNFRFDDMLVNPSLSDKVQNTLGYTGSNIADEFKHVFVKNEEILIKHELGTRNGLMSYSRLIMFEKEQGNFEDWKMHSTSKLSAINFFDLTKWIPDKKLEDACKDYDIGSDSKMNFDIVEYNNKIKENNYTIVDWVNLEDACKIFLKTKKKKDEINQKDYDMLKTKNYYNHSNNMLNIWELCKEYCLYDCKATKELGKKIYGLVKTMICDYESEFGIITKSHTMFSYMTPATLAFEFLSKSFAEDKTSLRLLINHANYGKFIHDSYFGGRCDFSFIGKYKTVNGNLRYYDVTSEYPCAMMKKYPVLNAENDMITGAQINLEYYQNIINAMVEKRRISRKFDDFTIYRPFDEEFNGIFVCNIYPPKDITELITFAPMATRKEKQSLQYENIARKNIVLNTAFMKNYIMSGYSIILIDNPYNTVFTNLQYIFTKFIDHFGKAKAESKEELNKTKAKLYKLIINSIAGKLAQKPISNLKTSETTFQARFINNSNIEDWTKSNHYLATFIIAEANFMLYSTLYRLQLTNIYNKVPHSERCGALLYMDTDSIIFDQDLCDNLDWNFSENIGSWNESTNYFDITWKAKYKKKSPNQIVCIGKKSYIVMKDNEIIDKKLKGVHGAQMDNMIKDLDDILDGNRKTIIFEGMQRKGLKVGKDIDINKEIKIAPIQKSLTKVDIKNVFSINCTNEQVNNINKENKLFFCISRYEN